MLQVSRQGFYCFLKHWNTPWKYEDIADKMCTVAAEDEWNDTYGRSRRHDTLKLKDPEADIPRREDRLQDHEGDRTMSQTTAEIKRDHEDG